MGITRAALAVGHQVVATARQAATVADDEEAFSQAVADGGHVVTSLADDAFGQRGGRIRDPFGSIWWVVSRVEDVSEDCMWKRLCRPPYTHESMRVAQETLDAELGGRPHGRSSAPFKTTG